MSYCIKEAHSGVGGWGNAEKERGNRDIVKETNIREEIEKLYLEVVQPSTVQVCNKSVVPEIVAQCACGMCVCERETERARERKNGGLS